MINKQNIVSRFITTKAGTYVLWYDLVARKYRRVNLSKNASLLFCCANRVAGLRK